MNRLNGCWQSFFGSKSFLVLTLSLLGVVLALGFASQGFAFGEFSCRHEEDRLYCAEFLSAFDGDTFRAHIPGVHPLLGRQILVRVNGVDAPEIRSTDPCEARVAQMARDFAESFLKDARQIELRNVARDKYFRILADVYADGRSLGAALVRRKLAVEYDGTTKEDVNWCRF